MACCSRGVRGMLMAGKCNRFLRIPELLMATWIRISLRRFSGKEMMATQGPFKIKHFSEMN